VNRAVLSKYVSGAGGDALNILSSGRTEDPRGRKKRSCLIATAPKSRPRASRGAVPGNACRLQKCLCETEKRRKMEREQAGGGSNNSPGVRLIVDRGLCCVPPDSPNNEKKIVGGKGSSITPLTGLLWSILVLEEATPKEKRRTTGERDKSLSKCLS